VVQEDGDLMQTAVEPGADTRAVGRVAFIAQLVAGGLALAVLWVPKYLPMIDLPQHAAQLSIWQHYRDPDFRFEEQFELHFEQPYLLGYAVAKLFTPLAGPLVALKVTLSLYVVALYAAVRRLLSTLGADVRLAVIAFPIAFGFSFSWGFFNFVVAMPLGIWMIAEALDSSVRTTRLRALRLAAIAVAAYWAHLFVLGVSGLVAGVAVLLRTRSLRATAKSTLPMATPLPLAVWWLASTTAKYEQARLPTIWGLGKHRVPELFGGLLSGGDLEAVGMVALLVASIALVRPRLSRDAWRWAPLAVALLLFACLPHRAFGTFFLYQRLPAFAALLALVPIERASLPSRDQLRYAGVAALVSCWMVVQVLRGVSFDAEARQFDPVLEYMQPGRSAVAITVEPRSESVPGPQYLHFLAWYQAQKGGRIGFSFAEYSGVLARYRPGAQPAMTRGLEWFPGLFAWEVDGGFDYFVVRSAREIGPELFRGALASVQLRVHSGDWWLYENVSRAPLQR
jgi:hypothetical protein